MHGHNDRGIFPSKNIMLFFVPEEHKEIFSASLFFSFSAVIPRKMNPCFLFHWRITTLSFATIHQLSKFTYNEKNPLANNDYHVPSTGPELNLCPVFFTVRLPFLERILGRTAPTNSSHLGDSVDPHGCMSK